MKHLIIVAHPVEDSFTMALARAYAAQLEQLGHTQHTSDLYRMGFNPTLAAHELPSSGAGQPVDAEVARAQQEIRDADVLTVVYPLWWMAMPAVLKGYVDRVFAHGFAYQNDNGTMRGLLGGRAAVLITLSGAPLVSLVESGKWAALQTLQDSHMFRFSGFDVLEHLHFDDVSPLMPVLTAEQHLAQVRACARHLFPPA
jgi:NAD(P)H dehydrogenase (quinone)